MITIEGTPIQVASLINKTNLLKKVEIVSILNLPFMDISYGFVDKVYFNQMDYITNWLPTISNVQLGVNKEEELKILNREELLELAGSEEELNRALKLVGIV